MKIQDVSGPLMFENYPAGTPKVEWPLINSWFMMDSLVPGLWCCAGYLVFVLWLGPLMMSKRKPYALHTPMLIYNLAQVVFSSYLVYRFVGVKTLREYFIESVFSPSTHKMDLKIEKEFSELVYYYMLSKYVEFIDTVFFVLRRKENQITFLHVYHHANMAISTWLYLKYVRAGHIVFVSQVNSFVHAVMYSYYFLSALGSWIRPYLWWKKYITKLQLAQFVLVIGYIFTMVARECPVQTAFAVYTIVNTSSFLLLFLNFYRRAYHSSKSPVKVNKST